jgi:hypothetical protein
MTTTARNPALGLSQSEGAGVPVGAKRPRTAQVCRSARGPWGVLLPNDDAWVSCGTLSAATRIATRWAQHNPPSELIIRDAYHRVVLRKSFGDGDARARSR